MSGRDRSRPGGKGRAAAPGGGADGRHPVNGSGSGSHDGQGGNGIAREPAPADGGATTGDTTAPPPPDSADPSAAAVLPFPPGGADARGGAAARPRSRPHPGPDDSHDGAAQEDADAPPLAEQVARLAARGLDEEEIRARLGLPERLDAAAEAALAEAYRRGQLLGRARIKEAMYETALQGRVTAQARVLVRLGEPRGEAGGELAAQQADTAMDPDSPEGAGP